VRSEKEKEKEKEKEMKLPTLSSSPCHIDTTDDGGGVSSEGRPRGSDIKDSEYNSDSGILGGVINRKKIKGTIAS
jgi:hypothetical protein